MGGTVMGDLEHIHRRQRGIPVQQPLLRRRFEVAQEQQGQPAGPYVESDAGIIRLLRYGPRHGSLVPRCAARSPASRRPQDSPVEGPDPAPFTGDRPHHGDARRGGRSPDERDLVQRLVQVRRLDRPDRSAPQHTGQPPYMVRVEMREDQKRHLGDAQVAQTSIDEPRIGTGVDDHPRPSPAASTRESP